MPKARNMIIDGFRKGTQLYKDQYGLYYMFNGRQPIKKTNVVAYQILTEESSKDAVSTVGRGLAGAALFGTAGISASLTGKENKIYTVRVDWDQDIFKNSGSSIFELDSEFYKVFVLQCTRTEEDWRRAELAKRLLHPERHTQESSEEPQKSVSNPEDIRSKLRELKSMFEEGLITEEEYNSKKQELLSKM